MKRLKELAFHVLALVVLALGPLEAAWSQVTVTAADPASTVQGTLSLDVTISGKGFNSSAAVRFLVSGTTEDTGGISVRKVAVKGSTRLVATIDVPDGAAATKFDIEVSLSDGRKGKGTTLFTVQPKLVGNDPCSQPGLDFPAFTYLKDTGQQTRDIYVADATGVCSRLIVAGAHGGGAAMSRFSFPVAGTADRGRVAYGHYDGVSHSIVYVDFTVAGTSVSVGPRTPLVPAFANALDLSPDGTALYYAVNSYEGGAYVGRLFTLRIPDHIGQPSTLLFAGTGLNFFGLSVDAEHTALYADRGQGSGSGRRLERFDLTSPGGAPTLVESGYNEATYPAANDSTAPSRFAFIRSLLPSGLACTQLILGEWTGAGASLSALPQYGRRLSWYGGSLLTDGYTQPSRRGECVSTGFVTRVSPMGVATQLVKGTFPDGR